MEDPACSGCHAFVDPIGFGLERFDGIGRFRMLDNGGLIDPSGSVDGVDFEGFTALVEALANHPAFTECLSRSSSLTPHTVARTRARKSGMLRSWPFRADGHDLLALMRRIALASGLPPCPWSTEVSP